MGETATDGQSHTSSQGIAWVTTNLTLLRECIIDSTDIAPCSSNYYRVIIMILLLCPWRRNVVPCPMSGISDYRPETLIVWELQRYPRERYLQSFLLGSNGVAQRSFRSFIKFILNTLY